MSPVVQKWNHERVAMLTAKGAVERTDILELLGRMSAGDLSENKKIYIDLNEVTFFSPYAAALLIGSYDEIKRNGKKLMFINPNEVSEFLIKLFGADYIFPIVDGC